MVLSIPKIVYLLVIIHDHDSKISIKMISYRYSMSYHYAKLISYHIWFASHKISPGYQQFPMISIAFAEYVKNMCIKKNTYIYNWRFAIPMKYLFRFIFAQDGAPKIAKLPYFSGFMVDITIVNTAFVMVYKPTNITGGPHPAWNLLKCLRYEGFWKDGKQHGHGHYTTTVGAFPLCDFCGVTRLLRCSLPSNNIRTKKGIKWLLTQKKHILPHSCVHIYIYYIYIHRRNVSSFDGAVWFFRNWDFLNFLVDLMGIFHGAGATTVTTVIAGICRILQSGAPKRYKLV